jgi:hypothetical protein
MIPVRLKCSGPNRRLRRLPALTTGTLLMKGHVMAESQSTTPAAPVEYRSAPGFPGYRVGSDGSIWTAWRKVSLGGRRGTKQVIGDTWRLISLYVGRCAYPTASLRFLGGRGKNPVRLRVRVHTLVLTAFVGPRQDGMEACHNDGNPLNNRLVNLRWGTRADNMRDMIAHDRSVRGEKCYQSKLTATDVRNIRLLLASGVAHPEIARRFNITKGCVSDIKTRRCWSWLS